MTKFVGANVADQVGSEHFPENVNFVPQDKIEFVSAATRVVSDLPDKALPRLYKALQDAAEEEKEKKNKEGNKMNRVEQALRRQIRTILEAEDKSYFKDMAREFGYGDRVHAMRKEYNQAFDKLQHIYKNVDKDQLNQVITRAAQAFLANSSSHELSSEDINVLANDPAVVDQYIEAMIDTDELSDEEIEFMKAHKSSVSDTPIFKAWISDMQDQVLDQNKNAVFSLPSFISFVQPYVKKLVNADQIAAPTARVNPASVPQAQPRQVVPGQAPATVQGAPRSRGAGFRTVYGMQKKGGIAPLHTRVDRIPYVPTSPTRVVKNNKYMMTPQADGALRIDGPDGSWSQTWQATTDEPVGRVASAPVVTRTPAPQVAAQPERPSDKGQLSLPGFDVPAAIPRSTTVTAPAAAAVAQQVQAGRAQRTPRAVYKVYAGQKVGGKSKLHTRIKQQAYAPVEQPSKTVVGGVYSVSVRDDGRLNVNLPDGSTQVWDPVKG